jgi:predicted glycosyltransferase
MQRDRLMIYCQHLLGMGHLVRSLEVAGALARDWDVTFVTGGEVPRSLPLPARVEMVRLPAVESGGDFKVLSGENVKARRREMLRACYECTAPDVLVVELYPFGRKQFGFELMPLLKMARKNGTRVACSLRDILVRRPDQAEYEARVCEITREYFDLVLVHSDPQFQRLEDSFSRVGDLGCPVVYTGYVHRCGAGLRPAAASQAANCALLAAPPEAGRGPTAAEAAAPQIVCSIGAGKCESGHHLVEAVIGAAGLLRNELPHQFEIFTGPFMPEGDHARLARKADQFSNVTLSGFTSDLAGTMRRADLSVSMGGYNTIMDVLAANVRALVYPEVGNGDNEQRVRAAKLAAMGAVEMLESSELAADLVAARIKSALRKPPARVSLDMNGAEGTRRLVQLHLAPAVKEVCA